MNCFFVVIMKGSKNSELLNLVLIDLCVLCEKINVLDFGFLK